MVPPIRSDTNGMGLVTMSERDLKRIQVLTDVLAGRRTVVSAAAVLALGVRQTFRLLARYEEHGGGGMVHKTRGRASSFCKVEMSKLPVAFPASRMTFVASTILFGRVP